MFLECAEYPCCPETTSMPEPRTSWSSLQRCWQSCCLHVGSCIAATAQSCWWDLIAWVWCLACVGLSCYPHWRGCWAVWPTPVLAQCLLNHTLLQSKDISKVFVSPKIKVLLVTSSEPFLVGLQLIAVSEEQESRVWLWVQAGQYPARAPYHPCSTREGQCFVWYIPDLEMRGRGVVVVVVWWERHLLTLLGKKKKW